MQPNAVDAQALGLAMQLLFKTDRKKFSIAAAYVWLWPAIRLGQLVTIEDEDGVWTGYALWAYLTPETASHLVLQDPPFLPISDWNEGDQLWILDFVAMPGHHRRLARALRDRLRPHFKQAHRLVRDKTGAMLGTKTHTLRKDG
ncbi:MULTISPECIES: toxin-activating lysine-acyltransferase [Xanthomonas]|uniref:RTX toxin-activating lysine-acyltransferase n=1 Tax=Xanthomonas hortorum pv. carotae TaxID=487904 RepID=A0A6V7EY37_9XANT|nr:MULTISPECIES: toxin-activating lysine-acyltransferase [Xanthomonas]MCC5074588.1 toxin-activating lysine-acyltransferase [Xanthomonas campestris pv. plantaginis]MEA9605765.1 toxin-activating lysine-acyltransferase [Xanthomonas campestris pv. plantaginis]MEA9772767.1 toxin-activating lysine-acyltransferase [Xanthomonas campestris pv. raphani]MEA9801061.1 toxin-activating lysine-acyltransferase [Xanthomonas campestris pv. raphani]MEA9834078.1 toxin-activating lysine-acyltransferase [Xanthomona